MLYTKLTKKAMEVAYFAHKNQLDKGGIPYIYHPIHIAEQMNDEVSVCAALLHDVVEDTGLTFQELSDMGFPYRVIEVLKLLTHSENMSYMDYIRGIKSDSVATAIKLCDLRHNSDLTRLDVIGEYEKMRVKKYKEAIEFLEK